MNNTLVAPSVANGLLDDLLEKLSGEDGVRWNSALKRFLRGETPWPVVNKTIMAWKTIALGIWESGNNLIINIERSGCSQISIGAWDVAEKAVSVTAGSHVEVDLVIVSGAKLGFTKPAPCSEIYEIAMAAGLEKCPAEVGPALRIQYRDQYVGEWLLIGMEPVPDRNGDLKVFSLGRDVNGLWLDAYPVCPDSLVRPETLWVFARSHR